MSYLSDNFREYEERLIGFVLSHMRGDSERAIDAKREKLAKARNELLNSLSASDHKHVLEDVT